VWAIYFEDGLFEVFLGLALVLGGAVLFSSSAGILAPIMVSWGMAFQVAKKRYIAPRVGYVKPSSARSRGGLAILLTLAFVLGVLVFALIVARQRGYAVGAGTWLLAGIDWAFDRLPIVFGLILAGVFALLAYQARSARLAAYALLFGLGGVVFWLLKLSLADQSKLFLMSCGAALIVAGVIRLAWFLRSHPILPEVGPDERT
jgi:hypothetical protein